MLKSVVIHDILMDRVAAMERWYWRDHAPEIKRRFGPWLARHESHLPVAAPAAYLEFGEEFVSSFLLERPSDEFSRDARGYL